MWKNTAAIHCVLNKKNYKTKFSISSILKKKSTKKVLGKKYIKKTQKQTGKKTMLETL